MATPSAAAREESLSPARDATSSSTSRSRLPPKNGVFVNVYDIVGANSVLYPLGLGVHHTGVEIYGQEFAYGRCKRGTGVFAMTPKTFPGHVYRESLFVGTTDLTEGELDRIVKQFKQTWMGADYHIMRKNCNNFSAALCAQVVTMSADNAPVTSADGRYNAYDCGSEAAPPRPGTPPVLQDQPSINRNTPPHELQPSSPATPAGSKRKKLFPSWANRIARVGTCLPESLIAKIENADKVAQGCA